MTQVCTVDGCGHPVSDAYVCQQCTTSLERALGDVSWLLNELDVVLARQTATGERVGSRAAEKPLPYDPRATEARDVLANTVTTWARLVDEENPNAHISGPMRLGLLAGWLASWSGFLRNHQAGNEAVDEVLAAVGNVRRLIDTAPERWYAGPCAGFEDQPCGQDLYAKPGAENVTCPACGARYPVTERREMLMEAARDHLGTAVEVSRLCTPLMGELVTTAMIRGYMHRGKIAQHGTTLDARNRTVPLYRIGDVMDAATLAKFDGREQRATKNAGRV